MKRTVFDDRELLVLGCLSLTPQNVGEIRKRSTRKGMLSTPGPTLRVLVNQGAADKHGDPKHSTYTLTPWGETILQQQGPK